MMIKIMLQNLKTGETRWGDRAFFAAEAAPT
jgi:hypothetical protein